MDEHKNCGENWVFCQNPKLKHPYEFWRTTGHSVLSIADNDKDGMLGGTQFCISITGTREQLEKWGARSVKEWSLYLKSQLKEVNAQNKRM